MDKDSLQKLTVIQLRDKLKARHIQSTGTKGELIERLLESYQEEENLLAGTEENESLDDVDDLLGSNDLEKSALSSNEEALLLGLPSKVQVPKFADAPKPTVQEVKPKPAISSVTEKPQETVKKPEITSPAVDESGDGKSATETAPKTKQPIRPKVSVESTVTDEARKRRAERFGLPVKASTESEKKPTEAEPKEAAVVSEKHPISLNSNSKLLERAKRFGLPVQADDNKESNGASNAKKPRIAVAEGDSKKQARLQRFAS